MDGNRTLRLLLLTLASISVCHAMYNGLVAPVGLYPWIGSLQPKIADQHKCSVIILSHHWTMTSAHCVPMDPQYYKLVLGHGAPNIYYISDIRRHAHYFKNSTHCEHDIALLHTSREIEFNANIQAAILADVPATGGSVCWAVGQGIRYDDSARYLTVGMTEVEDAPHVDPVRTDVTWQQFIPDPMMTIPVNGNLTHWDIFVKRTIGDPSDRVHLYVLRPGNQAGKYTWSGIDARPTSLGPQRVNLTTPYPVKEGDTIGLYYDYKTAYKTRIPFRERHSCEMTSLYRHSKSDSHFTAVTEYPCREYAMRAYIKVNPSISAMAPKLEEIKVTVHASDKYKIVAAGKEAVPCKGDDGGSLSCNSGEVSTVYGMYSYSLGTCNQENTNAVFTQLSSYKSWIDSIISNCAPTTNSNLTSIQVLESDGPAHVDRDRGDT